MILLVLQFQQPISSFLLMNNLVDLPHFQWTAIKHGHCHDNKKPKKGFLLHLFALPCAVKTYVKIARGSMSTNW